MPQAKKHRITRRELEQKRFLNFSEIKIYLGISRWLLERIIKNDSTFPNKKTPRLWARVQIDEWEKTNSSLWWETPKVKQLTQTAQRFAFEIQSLN